MGALVVGMVDGSYITSKSINHISQIFLYQTNIFFSFCIPVFDIMKEKIDILNGNLTKSH